PAQNIASRALDAAWDAGATVRVADGHYVVSNLGSGERNRIVADYALRASLGAARGTVLPRARVGLYRPWSPSMDEGWTRWLFEQYAFSFSSLRSSDVHAGDLRSRYDVIILASDRTSSLMNGFAKGSVPARYEGGLGEEGIRSLDAFVRAGGTLVCMSASSDLCIDELHLPVENVVRGFGYAEAVSGLPRNYWIGDPPVEGVGPRQVGVEYAGKLVNYDVARYQQCVSNLYHVGALQSVLGSIDRQVIVEIGGGMGALPIAWLQSWRKKRLT
ncbi:MAG: hypothetical protein IIC97_11380, partial [Chloroflexi bacterium]|nr:hypothetical protein [Chloroflexota bacterium]